MEINGLPLHPLVVHAAVVLGPIGAILALVYVAVPRWRDRVRWPMVGLAVVAGLCVGAAYLTGGDLLDSRPQLRQLPAVETHEERAEKLLWVTIAFAVVALVVGWFHARPGVTRSVLLVALAGTALATLVLVVMTGDAGARAVWGA